MRGSAAIETFLSEVAEACDLTDINIAAGAAQQQLAASRPAKDIRRVAALAVATIATVTVLGDVFASSPVHAGIFPGDVHVLTNLGAPDWSKNEPSVFGHRLPWGHGPRTATG